MTESSGLRIPSDVAVERHLLGAVFAQPDQLPEVVELVAPDDFYRPWHGTVFEAVVAIGAPAEQFGLVREVAGRLDSDHDQALDLVAMLAGCPETRFAAAYAQRVGELAVARRLMEVTATAHNALGAGEPVEAVLRALRAAVVA